MLLPLIGQNRNRVITETLTSPLDTDSNYIIPAKVHLITSIIVVGGGGSGHNSTNGAFRGGNGGGGEVVVWTGSIEVFPGDTWPYRIGSGGISGGGAPQPGKKTLITPVLRGVFLYFETERDPLNTTLYANSGHGGDVCTSSLNGSGGPGGAHAGVPDFLVGGGGDNGGDATAASSSPVNGGNRGNYDDAVWQLRVPTNGSLKYFGAGAGGNGHINSVGGASSFGDTPITGAGGSYNATYGRGGTHAQNGKQGVIILTFARY